MEHYFFTFQSGTIQAKGYIHTIRNNLSLHSNLVQFKLLFNQPICHDIQSLYIPIWYNSSSASVRFHKAEQVSLHSNLVQFKLRFANPITASVISFTFQSGTIQAHFSCPIYSRAYNLYIPIWYNSSNLSPFHHILA